jgi:hypothetical protein
MPAKPSSINALNLRTILYHPLLLIQIKPSSQNSFFQAAVATAVPAGYIFLRIQE